MNPIPTDLDLALNALRAYPEASKNIGRAPDEYIDLGRGVEYSVYEYQHRIVIAVCGTEKSLADWSINFRLLPWRDKVCGWCHAGWLKAGRKIAQSISDNYADRGKKIIFTGHSKGAAEGIIAAHISKEVYGVDVAHACLFGAPKPFVFSRPKFKFTVRSYANDFDPVPKTPLFYQSISPKIDLETAFGHSMICYTENLKQ